jgi:hypothetical protein
VTARSISITFHTDVYKSKPWFQVPRGLLDFSVLNRETRLRLTLAYLAVS